MEKLSIKQDISDREGRERTFAGRLSRLFRQQLRRLMELLGDPPDANAVTQEYWDSVSQELRELIQPLLLESYLDKAEESLGESVIGVDWGLVNEQAAVWARQYTFDLVGGITQTSRNILQQTISRFFTEGVTIGETIRDLEKRLGRAFGPVRAEMIATTEVTRAAAQGELEFINQLENEGATVIRVWQTNNDEIVRRCPICWPMHRMEANENGTFVHPEGLGEWDGPPAHVRCRCWITTRLPGGN